MCITDENKTYTNVDFVAYEANFSIDFFIILNTKLSATRVAFFPMKLDVTLQLSGLVNQWPAAFKSRSGLIVSNGR